MIYFKDTTDFYMAGPTAITLGKFDGLHLGHQKLLRHIRAKKAEGLKTVVFALNARQEDLILTPLEQRQVLEEMGIECLVQCPFVPEISGMDPEAFVKDILMGRLGMCYAAVGTDFRFGYQRRGDAAFLQSLSAAFSFTAQIVEKQLYEGREISSTFIREALQEGNIPLANRLMGRPYQVSGIVIHGRHLGTRLGMPTANFIPPQGKLLPPNGVYVTQTTLGDGTVRMGVTNIGTKPTVNGTFRGVEPYLFDHTGDLYGSEITLRTLYFLRPEQRFDSLEELKAQIKKDISRGRAMIS